jgi:hypothetical protein
MGPTLLEDSALLLGSRIKVCFISKVNKLPEILDQLVLVLFTIFNPLSLICGRNLLCYICLLIHLTSISCPLKTLL